MTRCFPPTEVCKLQSNGAHFAHSRSHMVSRFAKFRVQMSIHAGPESKLGRCCGHIALELSTSIHVQAPGTNFAERLGTPTVQKAESPCKIQELTRWNARGNRG